MTDPIAELFSALSTGAIACIVLWIAWRKNFFRWPHTEFSSAPISLCHVLIVFGIYFLATTFGVIPVVQIIKALFRFSGSLLTPLYLSVWAHLAISLLIIFLFLLFGNGFRPDAMKAAWKGRDGPPRVGEDIGIGAIAWIISFPLVLSSSHLFDLFIYLVFHVQNVPDQTAVEFLKMTMNHPFYFFLNLLSIIVFAPLIEELMFRGFLQTYARKFLRPAGAIFVSSLCFSLFHFTPEQGLGNISIIGSLLILAFFLGFVYERQGSLIASISLHAIFNALSVLNLYFLGGTPRAPL